MAKIAILFVLVALFAICFAARVPREDAKTTEFKLPETFQEFQTQINKAIADSKIEETLKKTFSEDNIKELRGIAEKFGEQGKKLLEEANASLQKLGDKA